MALEDLLVSIPFAFFIYLGLAGLLALFGRQLAGSGATNPLHLSTYMGGERAPQDGAVPGYANMFVIALYFAVLHVGVLMLGSGGGLSPVVVIYLIGLVLVLVALMIG